MQSLLIWSKKIEIVSTKMRYKDTSELEISLLLEAVYRKYGYDFRQYSQAHIRHRIMSRMAMSEFEILELNTFKKIQQ